MEEGGREEGGGGGGDKSLLLNKASGKGKSTTSFPSCDFHYFTSKTNSHSVILDLAINH